MHVKAASQAFCGQEVPLWLLPLAGEVLVRFTPNDATDIQLTREKLHCMAIGAWLNDEVINLYMLLLLVRGILLRGYW